MCISRRGKWGNKIGKLCSIIKMIGSESVNRVSVYLVCVCVCVCVCVKAVVPLII